MADLPHPPPAGVPPANHSAAASSPTSLDLPSSHDSDPAAVPYPSPLVVRKIGSSSPRPVSTATTATTATSNSARTVTASPTTPVASIAGADTDPFPLAIPTKHNHLLSGFPYHQALYDAAIAPLQWEQLNTDILRAVAPSRLDRAAARASRIVVPPIGPVSAGLAAFRRWNDRSLAKRMLAGLDDDDAGRPAGPSAALQPGLPVGKTVEETTADTEAAIAATLRRWNTEVFAPRGLTLRLALTANAEKRRVRAVRQRRAEEQRRRERYGTAAYYAEDGEDAEDPADEHMDGGAKAGDRGRYRLVVSRQTTDEPPPQYEPGGWSGGAGMMGKKGAASGGAVAAVELPAEVPAAAVPTVAAELDSGPPGLCEMDATAQEVHRELPAE